MSYTVRYSPRADSDIYSIWNVICAVSHNYDIADDYIDGIIKSTEDKKEFPKSGVPVTYHGVFTGFYFVQHKKYLSFYRIKNEYIEVARILISSANLKILFGDIVK